MLKEILVCTRAFSIRQQNINNLQDVYNTYTDKE